MCTSLVHYCIGSQNFPPEEAPILTITTITKTSTRDNLTPKYKGLTGHEDCDGSEDHEENEQSGHVSFFFFFPVAKIYAKKLMVARLFPIEADKQLSVAPKCPFPIDAIHPAKTATMTSNCYSDKRRRRE